MLKRETLLLLIAAIVLGGGVLLFESHQRNSSPGQNLEISSETGLETSPETNSEDSPVSTPNDKSEGELIFPFSEEDVKSVTVERVDGTLTFSKFADGTWQMTAPEQGIAESGAIAFLLSQITNPTTHTLTVAPNSLKDFGLDQPETTVTLVAADTSYQLAVGTADFTGDKLYVQLIKPAADTPSETAESVKIHVVSGGLKNAINRPTKEWLIATEPPSKPEAEKPTAQSTPPENPEAAAASTQVTPPEKSAE